MLKKLLRRGAEPRPAPEAPPDTRVYAIGDIHGRSDLLGEIHRRIRADADAAPQGRKVVIYVGDYVDRGDDSRGVIDVLSASTLPGFDTVHLMGNHEDIMMRFLEDASVAPLWIANGGDATLYSYGVVWRQAASDGDFEHLRAEFRRALPESHLRFLRRLAPFHVEGDYLFVHAGIRPGREIELQDAADLMWIRGEFLDSDADHGKVVVHGHTISPEPVLRDNRIGIDTGAVATGRLTCLVLDGSSRRILQT